MELVIIEQLPVCHVTSISGQVTVAVTRQSHTREDADGKIGPMDYQLGRLASDGLPRSEHGDTRK